MPATKRKRDVKPEPLGQIEPDRKILVAVDFGTTFNGLAWVQTRRPEVQTPIVQWPDNSSGNTEGVSSEKVPTEVAYVRDEFRWGYQIESSQSRQQWFKLDLDPSQKQSTYLSKKYPDRLAAPPGYTSSAEKQSTDYLTALKNHVEQVLKNKLPESALKSAPIEYIITVPAVWSDMAQSKTRKCAEKAGMGNASTLHIISEPEAAAMYALHAMDPHGIVVGDSFVLCDAGGGTVDLITYTVDALKPVLRLSEAVAGKGLVCGSSILNRRFQEWLEDLLGKDPDWDDEVLEVATKDFEDTVKRRFRGTRDEKFLINVPGIHNNDALGVKRGRLTMLGTDVRKIFEPVVMEVIKLVLDQITTCNKSIKAVLLVGGFGSNPYLRDEIAKEVKRISTSTAVMQPQNGWTAVVRGALMKALATTSPSNAQVRVTARHARKHFGISANVPFEEGKHDTILSYWDPYDGMYRIGLMDWFIKKGDKVEEQKPIRLPYSQNRLRSEGGFRSIETEIRVCSDLENRGAPKYKFDSGVQELVRVYADLSRIPIDRIPQKRGADGQMYYMVNFEIQVTYFSAHTTYELIYNGKNYGKVDAELV